MPFLYTGMVPNEEWGGGGGGETAPLPWLLFYLGFVSFFFLSTQRLVMYVDDNNTPYGPTTL